MIRELFDRKLNENVIKVCSTSLDQRLTASTPSISLFKEISPDVVTMDLTMPNLDGIGCIKGLVKLDPSCKILVISALNDKATGMEAL